MLLNAAFVEWTTVGRWTRVHHLLKISALGESRLFHVMNERDTLCGQNVTRSISRDKSTTSQHAAGKLQRSDGRSATDTQET